MDSNNLGRYTVPTTPAEKAFFARHSGAITRYTISVVVIQAAWGFFSYNPAVALLRDGTGAIEWLSPYIPFIAAGILMILHKTLREETTEAFSNLVDKDDLTINRWWNYAIPVVVAVGLFILDFKGVSTTLRDTSFEGKKTTATAQSDSALNKAKSDYIMAITTIAGTRKDDSLSAVAPFKSRLQQAESIRTYDNLDVAAKNRKIASIKSERDAALVSVRKEASQAVKDALTTYKAEKTRITGIVDSTHQTLDGKDADNAANAESKGWYISTFFMLLFLLMTYKLVVLRTKAGIRINVQFTALDATGSFIEKLLVVITNLLQRQGHRLLVFTHKLGSVGTAELRDFDGNVVLKQSSYNGSKIAEPTPSVNIDNSDLNGDNGTVAPPPPPPLPPSNNGGGDDDGRTPPQLPAAPVPTNAIQQPQTATASAVATSSLRWNDLNQDEKLDALNYMRAGSSKPLTEYLEMCEKLNPVVEKKFTNIDGIKVFCPLQFDEIYKAVAKTTPSVEIKRIARNDARIARHEVGHALAHMIICNAAGIKFIADKLEINEKGGCYYPKYEVNSVSEEFRAIINMAGFANESFQMPEMNFNYITKIENDSADYKNAVIRVGEYNVESAFNKAKDLLKIYQGDRNESFIKDLLREKTLNEAYLNAKYRELFPLAATKLFATLSDAEKKQIIDSLLEEGGKMIDSAIITRLLIEQNPTTLQLQDKTVRMMLINTAAKELAEKWYELTKKHTPTPLVETPVTPVTTPVTESNPAITEKPVTPPFAVTTPVTTVTTTKTEESNAHGDRVLKDMKRGFQLEIGNIKSKNGTYETVMDRLIKKNREFDQAIRNREMKCSVKVVAEISEWVLDNVQPLITEYLKGNKEGSNE